MYSPPPPKKKYIRCCFASLFYGLLLTSLVSCQDVLDGYGRKGGEIRFGASTGYSNGLATRSEYSGKDETDNLISSSSSYERIDWVSGSDQIRILCEAAENGPAADYDVSGATAQGKNSVAGIEPAAGNGLRWGEGTHYFYAMYPVPGMSSNYSFRDNNPVPDSNAAIAAAADNKATVSGRIPSVQEVVLVGNEFKPNMNYAYMYAAVKRESGSTEDVRLEFKPLVTTFEFTLLSPADDPITQKLISVKLSSKTTHLIGNFSATLSTEADPTILTTNTGKEITVTLPGGGVTLNSTNAYKITMLALPVEQKDLMLTLIFEGGIQRTLELKNNGSFITVTACRKVYIRNLGVPGTDVWNYHISTTNPTGLTYEITSSTTGRVESYRTKGSMTEAVPWSIEGYYSDPGCNSAISKPGWVRTTTSGNGSTSPGGQTFSVSCSVIPPSLSEMNNDTFLPASSFGSGSSQNNYYNLSNPSNMTSNSIAESANCYIVNSPGYYRIPLVMGNGIVGNVVNNDASSYQGTNIGAATYFKDYKGNAGPTITSPYLHKTGPGVGVPTSAHVVWEDVENLIEVVGTNYTLAGNPISITGSGNSQVYWLCFHVNDCPTGDGHNYKGNAVIAVTDQDGTVMWSWHIWVTDYIPKNYPGYSSSANNDVLVTNRNGENYSIMPLNLGWAPSAILYTYTPRTVYVKVIQETSGKTAVINITQLGGQTEAEAGRTVTFQQGRKDAMWPNPGYERSEKTWYGRTPKTEAMPKPITIDEAIKHPDRFVGSYVDINADFYSEGLASNLWGANLTISNPNYLNVSSIVKTIYDPCPAGYRVPLGKEFTGFFNNPSYGLGGSFTISDFSLINAEDQDGDGIITAADNKKGWYLYTNSSRVETVFFPSNISRGEMYGDLSYVGSFYWYAVAAGQRNAQHLRFGATSVGVSQATRNQGGAIRPVNDL